VYSEVVKGVDTRSAIGLHVLQHVPDFVETNTILVHGQPMYSGYRGLYPVRVSTCIRVRGCRSNANRERRRTVPPVLPQEPNYVQVSRTLVFEKLGGFWYRFDFRYQHPDEWVTVVGGEPVAAALPEFPQLVFISKRQCDRKTIRKIERGDFGVPIHR
jgi:hypothetical protein